MDFPRFGPKMPVAGLSKVLENLLESVLDTHSLKNWSIFHEENGEITFKIKFAGHIEHQGEGRPHCPSIVEAYRKKSSKQVERDRLRAANRVKSTTKIPVCQNSDDIDNHNSNEVLPDQSCESLMQNSGYCDIMKSEKLNCNIQEEKEDIQEIDSS